ncbi:MAG: S41 family peptidase [Clostridia bacterium]
MNDKRDFFDEEFDKESKNISEQNEQKRMEEKDKLEIQSENRLNIKDSNNVQITEGYNEYKRADNESAKPIKPRSKGLTVLLIVVMLVAVFALGIGCQAYILPQRALYDKVASIIENKYLFNYDKNQFEFNAAAGAVSGLDAYTRVLDPYSYYELINAVDTELYGVGYTPNTLQNRWEITSIVLDSPADYAISSDGLNVGLRKGDLLISINGTVITAQTPATEIKSLLSGGDAVFVVSRDNKTITFNPIKKRLIVSRYVEYFFYDKNGLIVTNMKYYFQSGGVVYSNMFNDTMKLDENYVNNNPSIYPHYEAYKLKNIDFKEIGYIKLHEFSFTESEMTSATITDFNQAMQMFKTSYNEKGKLILDLNDNPGGYNVYCEQVARYFIYKGKANETLKVYKMIDKNKKEIPIGNNGVKSLYADYFDEKAEGKQFVILTSGNSASASEMLTGAVLAYDTGLQIGTQTYGKGISQTVEPIKAVTIKINNKDVQSAYALYYTFAFFYTPTVEGSNSIYNNYCNQSDMNGNGKIDGEEKARGYLPLTENYIAEIGAQLARANEVL